MSAAGSTLARMTTPAPGWYPAPDGQPYERWWAGQEWGDHTRPLQQTQPPAAAYPSKMVTYQPVRTSHTFHLIMSLLTCGLWALFVWGPITILNAISKRRVVTRLR
ncbi:MAG: hypothetical protein JWP14_3356 [Frankiales bacterium]|nr:hypothetical protein [Frankiales bacterium]